MFSLDPRFVLSQTDLLLHELLDYNMVHHGNDPIYIFAFPGQKKPIDITYLDFGRVAHDIARYIRPDPLIGRNNEVVAILANISNLAYHTIVMGVLRSGLTPFPISHRNSAAAIVHMLQKTDCHRVLTTPRSDNFTTDALIDAIRTECPSGFPLNIEYIPHPNRVYSHIEAAVKDYSFEAYPPKKRNLSDVAVYLHSSGSTGFPKPIPQTFKTLLLASKIEKITDRATVDPPLRRLGTFGLPPFHAYAFFNELVGPLSHSLGVCIYPPIEVTFKDNRISISSSYLLPVAPTAENIIENARNTDVEAIYSVPTFLDNWATEGDEEKLTFLRRLRLVGYAGGPLAYEKGQFLVNQGVKVRTLFGGSEINMTIHIWVPEDPDHKDWDYTRFSERTRIDWAPQQIGDHHEGGARVFELRFLSCETHNPAIQNYTAEVEVGGKIQKISGYATSDLWERHPTKANLWRIVGRQDDVLTLSSGEKVVPGPIEEVIVKDKRIRNAVLFGRERNQVGVLVEPMNLSQEANAFIDDIWPTIEAATTSSPAFTRIFKHLILVTSKDKPMLRADKGTIKRKATIALYAEEVNALYGAAGKTTSVVRRPKSWSEEDVMIWLIKQAEALLSSSSRSKINAYQSVFEQGFDSLSAMSLRNQIAAVLHNSQYAAGSLDSHVKALPPNLVYSYAVISNLAKYIVHLASADVRNISIGVMADDRAQIIENTITRLSSSFKGRKCIGSLITPAVVLTTGTTGGLGSFFLALLLQNDKVKTVYALNRPGRKSSKQRQVEAFVDRHLPVELLDSFKVVFVEGDTAAENLGLDSSLYNEIRSSVTAIVHNAWELDFNLALPSFENHLQGTRRLIDLALSSVNVNSVRFLFTSSIGTAQSWPKEKGPYPEEMQHEAKYAVGSGYGEGKYVIERVLETSGLQATSLRIGQISGSIPSGYWATTDWFPLLVKSSVAMGSFPDLAGTVSWIPFTAVSSAMMDVLFYSDAPSLALNLVHPRPSKWTNMISAVRDAVMKTKKTTSDTDIPLVPFSQWFAQLEGITQSANEETLRSTPAVKILDFFRSLVAGEFDEDVETSGTVLLTSKMQALSQTVRMLEPIDGKDANAWVRYWNSKRFI